MPLRAVLFAFDWGCFSPQFNLDELAVFSAWHLMKGRKKASFHLLYQQLKSWAGGRGFIGAGGVI